MTDTPTTPEAMVTKCPRCGENVTSYWLNGCISKPEEYVLVADWIYHAACWDKQMEEHPPAAPDPQPTPEADIDPDPSEVALQVVAEQLKRFQYLFGYHVDKHPVLARFLAQALDRFAAQHSTAAPPESDLVRMTEHNVAVAADAYCNSRNSLGRHNSVLLHILEDALADRDRVCQQPIAPAEIAAPVSGDLDVKLRAAATAREVLAPYWNGTSRLLTTTQWEDLRTAIAKAIYATAAAPGQRR